MSGVAELRWWSAAPARSTDVGNAVCVCSIRATCRVVSIGSPVSLAVEQKQSKDDRSKKLNTSFTPRKSESDLRMWKLSATEKLTDVSYCTQQFRLCWDLRDIERLAYTQIYTAVDRTNGNSPIS